MINDEDLISRARKALKKAYSPYSNISVGAAVQAENNEIYEGCNVENSSYGLTVCAERVAILKAVSSGAKKISRIAITSETGKECKTQLMPCGACLQVILEFSGPDTEILVDGKGKYKLAELLPYPFKLQHDT